MKPVFISVALLLLGASCSSTDRPTALSSPQNVRWVSRELAGGGLSVGPNYVVTVFEDGRVEFKGLFHVKQKGTRTKILSTEKVAPIFSKIAALNIDSLKEDYGSRTTGNMVELSPFDTPWLVLSFSKGDGTSKKIQDLRYAPPELKEFAELVRTTADVSDWVGSKNEWKD